MTAPQDAALHGVVTSTVFKGVHYEMSVECNKCTWLIHSTVAQTVGEEIGMRVIPENIHIMNKLFPTENNEFEVEVVSCNEEENSMTVDIEDSEVAVNGVCYPAKTRLKVSLPPDGLHIAGDGNGDLDDVYIVSVIYKGEHNEIILESDKRKWIMQSDQDEQVATYVPISFDMDKAVFTEIAEEGGKL